MNELLADNILRAEDAILEAAYAVEALPGNPRLTDASVHLQEARAALALYDREERARSATAVRYPPVTVVDPVVADEGEG